MNIRGHRINTLKVQTPEGISFDLLPAGPFVRFLAWLMDLACIMILLRFGMVPVNLFTRLNLDVARAFMIIIFFVVVVGYGIVLEWFWRGQTLGKRMLRLRVMDEQGLRLQFSQVVIRNLLRTVDILPLCYMVGGIAACLNQHAQRLGDIAANTIVIRHPHTQLPDITQLQAVKYNSFRAYPHLLGRLRKHVPPDLAALALRALMRREGLHPEARLQLFADLAEHLRAEVNFPEEATAGLSSEQYVRNVVDILYQQKEATVRAAQTVKAS